MLASAALVMCGTRASAFVVSPGRCWAGSHGGLCRANSARAAIVDAAGALLVTIIRASPLPLL